MGAAAIPCLDVSRFPIEIIDIAGAGVSPTFQEEALVAAGLLEAAKIELLPTRSLLEAATRIAIDIDHPAYDCLSAVDRDCR